MKTLLALMAAVMLVIPALAFEQGKSNQAPSSPSPAKAAVATSTAPASTAPTSATPDTHSTGSAAPESVFSGMFSTQTIHGMIGTVVYFVLGLLMLAIGYKVVDFITPGNLSNELLGVGRAGNQPNYALALVAGALLLGLAIMIAAAIH